MNTVNVIFIAAILAILAAFIPYLIIGYSTISDLTQQDADVMILLSKEVTSVNMIENNTLIAQSLIYYPTPKTYAILLNNYDELIECLIHYESSGNPKAYNQYDPITESIGILQFKRATYKHFCVDKYKLDEDIWNENNQKICCANMLKDNLGRHWTTYTKCVKK